MKSVFLAYRSYLGSSSKKYISIIFDTEKLLDACGIKMTNQKFQFDRSIGLKTEQFSAEIFRLLLKS